MLGSVPVGEGSGLGVISGGGAKGGASRGVEERLLLGLGEGSWWLGETPEDGPTSTEGEWLGHGARGEGGEGG